jgi:MFS family permease/DNA-binding CsgD family transcriptional regulator
VRLETVVGSTTQARRRAPAVQIPADRWWIVGGMGLAVFMASLDMSIVNLALPAVRDTFGATTATTQWVVLGYLLPLVALALPIGRWLNGIDHRAVLVCACAGFGVASMAAGLAPSIGWLIAARMVQGLFGSALMTLIPVLTSTAVDARYRGRAMGLVDTLGMLGLISGPALGGLIVDSVGWPWIFYVNVPVCAALVIIAFVQLPRSSRIVAPERDAAIEAAVLTVAVAAVMIGLTLAAGPAPQLLVLALLAVPLVIFWYRLRASLPVRELLVVPAMQGPLAALMATAAATGLVFYIVPFHLLTVLHLPVPVAGLTMLTFPLAAAVLAPAAGFLADRYGDRRIALAGMVTLTVGLLLLIPAGQSWTASDVAWRLAVAGAGIGLFNAPNMSAAMSASPAGLLATAGAATSVARQGGFACGPALATLVWGLSGYRPGGIPGVFVTAAVVVVAGAVALADSLWPQSLRRLWSAPRDWWPAQSDWALALGLLFGPAARDWWPAPSDWALASGTLFGPALRDWWPARNDWASASGTVFSPALRDWWPARNDWALASGTLLSPALRDWWPARSDWAPALRALRPAPGVAIPAVAPSDRGGMATRPDLHAVREPIRVEVPITERLLGREDEERQITHMLQTVATGASAVLHIEGGWGSGRSLLLRQAADTAAGMGFTVVDGDWLPGAVPAELDGKRVARRPVLVVIDDLHHADPAFARSLRMLMWRLRDRPIAWLLSRRRSAGGPAVDELFAYLRPFGGCVDLRPLSPPILRLLLAEGQNDTTTSLLGLLRATGGNPLLAVELARGMQGEDADSVLSGPPAGVQVCVERCLRDLGDGCRQLVQVGAMLGVRFTLADVATMLRRPVADLLAPLDEALAADILGWDADRLVFTQELFWRSVLLSMPPPVRAALRQEAADGQINPAVTDLATASLNRGREPHDGARVETVQVAAHSRVPGIRLAVPVRPPAPGWTALSEMERQIVQLVSQGLTNQQIASHLFRSPNTVAYHLRQIFRKLDIHSRAELAG